MNVKDVLQYVHCLFSYCVETARQVRQVAQKLINTSWATVVVTDAVIRQPTLTLCSQYDIFFNLELKSNVSKNGSFSFEFYGVIYFFFEPEDSGRAFEERCTWKETHGHLFVQETIRSTCPQIRNLFISRSLLAR